MIDLIPENEYCHISEYERSKASFIRYPLDTERNREARDENFIFTKKKEFKTPGDLSNK
jgi:hypothetical protein